MKTKLIATAVLMALLPIAGFAQNPPAPPSPPAPPAPPNQPGPPVDRRDKTPKVPVTFLGVETSDVPRVVSEQLGLPKGFGLVVDYVVPDGPAAAAGVQQNDILKMLNDQILTEPDQLSKLIRSYNEGATITLTVLRKGQEQKISVKLSKKEVPQNKAWPRGHHDGMGDMDFGDLGDRLNNLRDQLGGKQGMIEEAVSKAHDQMMMHMKEDIRQRARDAAQRVRDQAQQRRDEMQRVRDEVQRARDEARRAGAEGKIIRTDESGLTTTKIDVRRAQIVFSDDKGELRIDNASGKKILTAKDPQSRLLFSGPVETQEELDKVPAEVRLRYETLQQTDLPSVVSSEDGAEEQDADDSDDMDDEGNSPPAVEQISVQSLPRNLWTFCTILI
jgi:serine protease Do